MELIFSRRLSFSSWAIRAVTWSRWSHVAAVIGGEVFESRAASGVQRVAYLDALRGRGEYELARVNCNDAKARAFLRDQIGKPYDWTAAFGVWMHRDWQEPDSWFCSELIAAAAQAGGVLVVRKPVNRITPEDIYTSPAVTVC
jgi:uncharacterized protein YycO